VRGIRTNSSGVAQKQTIGTVLGLSDYDTRLEMGTYQSRHHPAGEGSRRDGGGWSRRPSNPPPRSPSNTARPAHGVPREGITPHRLMPHPLGKWSSPGLGRGVLCVWVCVFYWLPSLLLLVSHPRCPSWGSAYTHPQPSPLTGKLSEGGAGVVGCL